MFGTRFLRISGAVNRTRETDRGSIADGPFRRPKSYRSLAGSFALTTPT
jgi:hypothetical protein